MTQRQVLTGGWRVLLGVLLLLTGGCSGGGGDGAGDGAGDGVVSGSPAPSDLPRGSGVSGRVTGPHGEAVALATFTVTSSSGESPSGPVAQDAVVSGPDGRFFIPLTPGGWTVEVTADGYRGTTFSVDVTKGEVAEHDVHLKARDHG